MNITIDQAIEIYARGFRFRKGHEASRSAHLEAERLKGVGDIQGCDVWRKVAARIEELDQAQAPPTFRH